MDCYMIVLIVICKNSTPVHDERSCALYAGILEPGVTWAAEASAGGLGLSASMSGSPTHKKSITCF